MNLKDTQMAQPAEGRAISKDGKPENGGRRIRKHISRAEKVEPVIYRERVNSSAPRSHESLESFRTRRNIERSFGNSFNREKPQGAFHARKDTTSHFEGNRFGESRPFRPKENTSRFADKPSASPYRPHTDSFEAKPYREHKPFVKAESRDARYSPKSHHVKPTATRERQSQHAEVVRYKDMNATPDQELRLNKYIANAGICSRREADVYIAQGAVRVNGEIVTELGYKVKRSDCVSFKGKTVQIEDKVYVLLNKPSGFVTTCEDENDRKTVLDLVKTACPERIYPVGRLDRKTTGVLLLTNDGDLAAQLTHPKFLKKKVYHVFLNREVSPEDMEHILQGVELEDGEIKADAIEYAREDDHTQVGIEIHSGRNRIVRRIFEELNYTVTKLDRVYFAGLTKKNLKRGKWRYLSREEVNMLKMGAFE